MLCRKATPKDADVIAKFQLAMALETEDLSLNQNTLKKGVSAVFEDSTKGCYYVVENGAAVIASLLITNEWSDWRNGTIWWIQSVYVVPEMRGLKVFRKLYDFIRSLAEKDISVKGLRLYVEVENQRAQAVYSKIGMDGDHYRLYEWMKPT